MATRAKKIILLSHCILNVNSKVEGINPFPGAQSDILNLLIEKGYGLIQLPCPEMSYFGISRWAHVRDQFDFPIFRKHCRKIFKPILMQVQDYLNNGYEVDGIIFVEGSPCCGLNKVTKGENWKGVNDTESYAQLLAESTKVEGEGIFVQEVKKLLAKNNLELNLYVLNEKQPELLLEELTKKL